MEIIQKPKYNSIDLMKFICCILIIALHTSPFLSFNKYVDMLFRNVVYTIALPFFFMSSSFLFFNKLNSLGNDEKKASIIKYAKRIGIMYTIWSGIYFIFVLRDWIISGTLNIQTLMIYIKDFFFVGSYYTIWFLPALLSAVLIVYVLLKKMNIQQVVCVSIIVHIFALLGSSYYGFTSKVPVLKDIYAAYFNVFITVKNGVFFGFLYVSLGAYIAMNKDKLSSKNSLRYIFMFGGLLLVEEVVLQYFHLETNGVDTKLFLIPLSYYLFLYVIDFKLKNGKQFELMRNLSLMAFLSQRIFLTLFPYVLPGIGLNIVYTNSFLYFIAILGTTLLFSYIILKLSEKIKFFKYLY